MDELACQAMLGKQVADRVVPVLRVGGDSCLNFAEGVRSCQLCSGTSMNRMENVFLSSTLPCVTRGDSDESGWRLSLNTALIKGVMLIVRGTQPDNGAVTICRCQNGIDEVGGGGRRLRCS